MKKLFDKTQKRILLARLETFYSHTLNEWSTYRNGLMNLHKPTTKKNGR